MRCVILDCSSISATTLTRQAADAPASIRQDRLKSRNGASVEVTSIRSGRYSTALDVNCNRTGPRPTTWST